MAIIDQSLMNSFMRKNRAYIHNVLCCYVRVVEANDFIKPNVKEIALNFQMNIDDFISIFRC